MEKTKTSKRVLLLTQTAILTAIIFLMSFTPIGYLKVGFVEITFLVIPVAVGAILLGPAVGTFLGFMFGVSSFIQCFTGSVFGAALLSINPIFTALFCIIPRTLMGFLASVIFRGMYKSTKKGNISCAVASLSASVLNTLLFILFLILFFGRSDYISTMMQTTFNTDSILLFSLLFVGWNGLIEAITCTVIGFGISAVLLKLMKTNSQA